MKTLAVKYISQITQGALEHNNDCGAACGVMLLQSYGLCKTMTVDQFYNSILANGDTALSISGIMEVLARNGISTDYVDGFTKGKLYETLQAHKPVLALIHYAPLVDGGYTQNTDFRGAHFVNISGMDIVNVAIQDPYRDDGVENVEIPVDTFFKSWDCTADHNPSYVGIVPRLPIQDLSQNQPVYAFKIKAGTNANLRSGAGENYPKIGIVYSGTKLNKVGGVVNGYQQVNTADIRTGWVWNEYIVKI